MQINANRATCIGSGQCVFTDPEAFDQDDDGTVVLLRGEPRTNEEISRATQAVHVCPSRSLSLVTDELEYS